MMEEMEQEVASAAPKGMSEDELAALLDSMSQQAVGYLTSEIAAEQEQAINYYYGRPFGDEQDGRSKVVDLTVAEVCDNAKAAILKPFVSSDQVVRYEPRGPEDEEAAKQATEYANYVINVDNDGFRILHDAAHDGLLQKLGVAKVWWEEKNEVKRETAIVSPQEFEAVAAEVVEGPFETEQPGVFEVVLEKQYTDGCVKIENIPPEEFRVSPYARSLETTPYVAHVTSKTRSALVEMGFDREVVEGLARFASDPYDDARKMARYHDEDEIGAYNTRETDRSQEMVEIHHEFPLVDFDGDGKSERREVIRCGDKVLYNEPVEDHPFVAWCPVPMPHKVYGRSYADLVLDMQRIRSVLQRQQLDNLYLANNPSTELPEQAERADGSTMEALLSPEIGRVIPTRQAGMMQPFAVPFVADKAFPMMEYTERQIMSRAGVSLVGQGLDPESLKRERTATEASIEDAGRNARLELVARIFGESFVKPLFRKVLALLVRHQPRERVIRLRNQWVPIDPRVWNAEMDVSISVGLGVNNKKEQLAAATLALETMERLAMSPYGGVLLTPKGVYETVKKLFEAAGFKNIDDFLQEPTDEVLAQQPEKPDPEMAKVQAEAQQKAAELQMKQEEAALKLQTMREEAAAKLQLERERAAAEMELARAKAETEAQLAREQMMLEAELARDQARMQAEIARETAYANADAKIEAAKIGNKRPGGDLSK